MNVSWCCINKVDSALREKTARKIMPPTVCLRNNCARSVVHYRKCFPSVEDSDSKAGIDFFYSVIRMEKCSTQKPRICGFEHF